MFVKLEKIPVTEQWPRGCSPHFISEEPKASLPSKSDGCGTRSMYLAVNKEMKSHIIIYS